MPEALWFAADKPRRVTLRSYAVLVGKAPTKQKRVKLLCTHNVTGQDFDGLPEWLANAAEYVMKNGGVVKEDLSINHVNLKMGDENLFHKTPVEAPRAKLSHMSIEEMGSGEDPDVVLRFQVIVPFSTDLNRWLGQMAGEEFEVSYELAAGESVTAGGSLVLSSEPETAAEEEEVHDALAEGDDGEEDEQKGQQRRKAARATRGATVIDQPATAEAVEKAREAIRLM